MEVFTSNGVLSSKVLIAAADHCTRLELRLLCEMLEPHTKEQNSDEHAEQMWNLYCLMKM
uniref:Uncharacterized protein n=1 Tax=Megaselia scalaris TaxID=36166 RepID=T1H0Q8_MEGSC